MTDDKKGGPAFPMVAQNWHHKGMTLRDYFAGQVMQSLVLKFNEDSLEWNAHENADIAYQIADAMIKAGE